MNDPAHYQAVALQLFAEGVVRQICPNCATMLFFAGLLDKVGDSPLTYYTPDCRVITYSMVDGVTKEQCEQFVKGKC